MRFSHNSFLFSPKLLSVQKKCYVHVNKGLCSFAANTESIESMQFEIFCLDSLYTVALSAISIMTYQLAYLCKEMQGDRGGVESLPTLRPIQKKSEKSAKT